MAETRSAPPRHDPVAHSANLIITANLTAGLMLALAVASRTAPWDEDEALLRDLSLETLKMYERLAARLRAMGGAVPESAPSSAGPTVRRTLEMQAQQLAERRDAFLAGLNGRVPTSEAERAEWSQLVAERQANEDALERLLLTERIADLIAAARKALAEGDMKRARDCHDEADYLGRKLGVRHG